MDFIEKIGVGILILIVIFISMYYWSHHHWNDEVQQIHDDFIPQAAGYADRDYHGWNVREVLADLPSAYTSS